jgi:acyl carrier protein
MAEIRRERKMDEKKLKDLVAKKLGVKADDIFEDTLLGDDRSEVDDFINDTVGDAFGINLSDCATDVNTFGELRDILQSKLK